MKDISGRRKFVQTFFLAPQEKGFFVLNDVFHFVDDGVVYPNLAPAASEKIDTQYEVTSLAEPPAPDYDLEEEAREYVNSVHIGDDPVDKYSLPDQQEQQLHEDLEDEIVVEETPLEETSPPIQNVAHTTHEIPVSHVEESLEEPPKKTYASILQVARGLAAAPQHTPQHAPQHSFKSASAPSVSNHVAQPAAQQSSSSSTYAPEFSSEANNEEAYGLEEEGEVTSVYVRNLSPNVTEYEIDQEFRSFGKIKPDGIFIRVRKEIGVCYAFVEFEDIIGVQNALQASPIQLAGRQVYIEERRPNSGGAAAARGGRGRGRGRGSYQTDAPRGRFGGRGLGRGNTQDASEYTRVRGDGYPQRGSR
ncbi:hypothetical protein PIB30_044710 [Stylosanthes scabra]|uniref:G3BP-like protein n=1 Tax=Stylosanthes scabra TaxID=79078 RepID=A0ABU6TFM0_9FABA|nr:hypothetical protein [Stylosanthes scabra]